MDEFWEAFAQQSVLDGMAQIEDMAMRVEQEAAYIAAEFEAALDE